MYQLIIFITSLFAITYSELTPILNITSYNNTNLINMINNTTNATNITTITTTSNINNNIKIGFIIGGIFIGLGFFTYCYLKTPIKRTNVMNPIYRNNIV